MADCGLCHPATAEGGTIAHPEKHVNGTLDVDLAQGCSACHGGPDNPAPPVDTNGGSATTLVTIGAHQAHVTAASNLAAPLACDDCHVVPTSVDAPGHMDPGPAEVAFGDLAAANGATPTWNRAQATCSSTYCHGASLTLAGGSNKAPVWTTVNNTQDACGTCHASATSGMTRPHPVGAAGSTCATCHGTTMTDNSAFKNKALHVNGAVEIAPPSGTLSCNGVCHGVTTGAAPANQAPPADTQGLTAVTLKSVGDHQNHLLAPALISSAMACNECHPVPTAIPDAATPAHLNKAVDVSFTIGTLSKKVAATTYSATTASCTRSYCHGGWTNSGAANTSETWTTGTALSGCTNRCHGLPPSTGRHRRSDHLIACGRCHADVAKTSTPNGILTTTAARALHINGNPDVRMSGGGSWNATTRSCSPSGCHGSESWGARVLPL
jgi:predicted CxxxxCH...CXXCH cytochrome family protein